VREHFHENFAFAQELLPAIRNIVGPLLMQAAPWELDAEQATDLLVLKARDMRIACRVRRPGFGDKYRWQITFRSKLDSGVKTELQKIVDGWADAMFYGHADERGTLYRWFVVNLDSFRAHAIRHKDELEWGNQSNHDGTHFTWFDLRSFPATPPILYGSSHGVPYYGPQDTLPLGV